MEMDCLDHEAKCHMHRNVGNYLPIDMTPYRRRPLSLKLSLLFHNALSSKYMWFKKRISNEYELTVVLRLWMDEQPPMWMAAANILNKQSRTADKGWSSSLEVGRGADHSPRYVTFHKVYDLQWSFGTKQTIAKGRKEITWKTLLRWEDDINPLNTELNAIFHLLALVEAHHILHVTRERVNYKQTHTDLTHYLFTPCSRVLLEKLTVSQLVKKFPAFYGTRRFITASTCPYYLSLSWAISPR